jgi:hypothetical protein
MSEDDTDTMEDGENSSGSRNRDGSRNGKNGKINKRGKKGGDNSLDEGSNYLNLRNGNVKNYNGPYSENHNSDNDASRVHLDILKDPRYFHFSKEFGVGFHEDKSVVFPKVADFKFDLEKY